MGTVIDTLREMANELGHDMSCPEHCVDLLCAVCIECGREIVINRDSDELRIDDALVSACK
jgi:hypothetical protein